MEEQPGHQFPFQLQIASIRAAMLHQRGKGVTLRGRQFALDLLRERNVAVAPGSGFGSISQEFVRISLAASDEEIERGVREICAFADR